MLKSVQTPQLFSLQRASSGLLPLTENPLEVQSSLLKLPTIHYSSDLCLHKNALCFEECYDEQGISPLDCEFLSCLCCD